jgi:hypothetical protein
LPLDSTLSKSYNYYVTITRRCIVATTKKTEEGRNARKSIGVWRRRLHLAERDYVDSKDGSAAEWNALARMDTAYATVMRLMSAEEKLSAKQPNGGDYDK